MELLPPHRLLRLSSFFFSSYPRLDAQCSDLWDWEKADSHSTSSAAASVTNLIGAKTNPKKPGNVFLIERLHSLSFEQRKFWFDFCVMIEHPLKCNYTDDYKILVKNMYIFIFADTSLHNNSTCFADCVMNYCRKATKLVSKRLNQPWVVCQFN